MLLLYKLGMLFIFPLGEFQTTTSLVFKPFHSSIQFSYVKSFAKLSNKSSPWPNSSILTAFFSSGPQRWPIKIWTLMLHVEIHGCNLSTQEVETGELWVPDHPGLHSVIVSSTNPNIVSNSWRPHLQCSRMTPYSVLQIYCLFQPMPKSWESRSLSHHESRRPTLVACWKTSLGFHSLSKFVSISHLPFKNCQLCKIECSEFLSIARIFSCPKSALTTLVSGFVSDTSSILFVLTLMPVTLPTEASL